MATWSTEKLITYNAESHSNIVSKVHFNVKHTQDDKVCETRGEVDVEFNDDTFTQNSEVTEDMTINWVKNTLGTEKVPALENLVSSAWADMESDESYKFVYKVDSLTKRQNELTDLPW